MESDNQGLSVGWSCLSLPAVDGVQMEKVLVEGLWARRVLCAC